MDILSGKLVIILDDRDVEALARQLARTIKLAYGAPGKPPPPRPLLDLADEISRAADRSSARFREGAQVSTAPGTGGFRSGQVSACSDQEPATLTVNEAAKRAGVSEGLMRRCCRRGDVTASQGHQGAWVIDTDSLAAWTSRRRRENQRPREAA